MILRDPIEDVGIATNDFAQMLEFVSKAARLESIEVSGIHSSEADVSRDAAFE